MNIRSVILIVLSLFAVVGWSSPEARLAHSQEVAGSNPAPAPSLLEYSLPETFALSVLPEVSRQPVPPAGFTPYIGFAWSASGDHFAETRANLEYLFPNVSLDAVLAIRLKDNVPAPGLGISYQYLRDRWAFAAGAAFLMPQNDRFDFTAGFSLGVRF